MHRIPWSEEEIEMLKQGINPSTRSIMSCKTKRSKLGIRLKTKPWTAEEIELLRNNKPIKGRTHAASQKKAFYMGIAYNPKHRVFWVRDYKENMESGICPPSVDVRKFINALWHYRRNPKYK